MPLKTPAILVQLTPPMSEVTSPVPCPFGMTFKVKLTGMGVNEVLTKILLLTVTLHGLLEHPPPVKESKVFPVVGVAVRTTTVPDG